MPAPFEIAPFGAALGAEVRGVDVRRAGEPELSAAIRRALLAHHVLAFPAQHLTDGEHTAFAATLGKVYVHPIDCIMGVTEPVMGHLDTTKDHDTKTDTWHLDVEYSLQPPSFAVNRCVIAPSVGGDTMWANLHLAYEALSPAFRGLLVGLFVTHDVPDALAVALEGLRRLSPRGVTRAFARCEAANHPTPPRDRQRRAVLRQHYDPDRRHEQSRKGWHLRSARETLFEPQLHVPLALERG